MAIATLPSRLSFAAGAWLLVAPFALSYSTTGTGFRAYWNDVVVGVAVIAVAALQIAAPGRLSALPPLAAALGGWLAAAPFVLGFASNDGASGAVVNDVLVGALVVVLALVGRSLAADSRVATSSTRRSPVRQDAIPPVEVMEQAGRRILVTWRPLLRPAARPAAGSAAGPGPVSVGAAGAGPGDGSLRRPAGTPPPGGRRCPATRASRRARRRLRATRTSVEECAGSTATMVSATRWKISSAAGMPDSSDEQAVDDRGEALRAEPHRGDLLAHAQARAAGTTPTTPPDGRPPARARRTAIRSTPTSPRNAGVSQGAEHQQRGELEQLGDELAELLERLPLARPDGGDA